MIPQSLEELCKGRQVYGFIENEKNAFILKKEPNSLNNLIGETDNRNQFFANFAELTIRKKIRINVTKI